MREVRRGFTLIELVITLALVAIVAAIAVTQLNPAGQFAAARNAQREAHLNTILNGVRQNIGDTQTGTFNCAAGALPTSSTRMASGAGNYDIAPCLVPTYLFIMPFDPSDAAAHYTSNVDYDSGYFIAHDTSTNQITLSAPSAELGETVSIVR